MQAANKHSTTHKTRVGSAKVSAKVDTGKPSQTSRGLGGTLAPPMSSVVVERHQPVSKVIRDTNIYYEQILSACIEDNLF